MARLSDVVDFCNSLLKISEFQDYPGANNGLQVQNSGEIRRIAAAVDANGLTIRRAVQGQADLLLVHHGLFWGKNIPFAGPRVGNYGLLFAANLALYSCHLPLDFHREIGNNASLLRLLDLEYCRDVAFPHDFTVPVGATNRPREDFRNQLLGHFPGTKAMEFGSSTVEKVLVCSGGGGSAIASIESADFDTVVTGEAPRHFFDFAYEHGLNAYVCGHYATEVFGVKNLLERVAAEFRLPTLWIHEDCPL
jgi:dinuclear metal center YbgI/SA1388 family protein